TIIVEPPRLFPQTLPQLLDLDHKLVEFPLRRRQRPVRPRHQKETGIRPSGSFAGLEQRSLCLRHSCLLVIPDTASVTEIDALKIVDDAAIKVGPLSIRFCYART